VRSRISRAVACFLVVLLIPLSGFAATKTFTERVKKAAISSVTSIGIETAVKLLGGMLYNTTCSPPSDDTTAKFLCDVLGSVTGRTDEEWQKKVDKQLGEIKDSLDVLTQGQADLKRSISHIDTTLNYEFENIAPKSETFKVLANIDALWTRYTRLVSGRHATNKQELLDFANDVTRQNLHAEMAKLNTVITTPIMDAESVVRYPYVKWQKLNPNLHSYNFDPSKIYDVAEKKFMDLRLSQEKGYLIYLWAAEVLESRCAVDPANCARPPVSSKRFADDYQADLKQQLAAFNAALDWFVLAYSEPHYADASLMLPEGSRDTITRANYFTATLLGPPDGMWGRVYGMGDRWNGQIRFVCDGAANYDEKPLLEYKVPVNDSSGSLDWWTSTGNNSVYDEIRFAKEWRGAIYRIPAKREGACKMAETFPPNDGRVPWRETDTEMLRLENKEKTLFGSFLSIQRAGGSYALINGEWAVEGAPQFKYEGGAKQRQDKYEWTIDARRAGVPYISLYYSGSGAWKGFDDTQLHQRNVIHIYRRAPIKVPDGGALTLVLGQSTDCAKVCRNNRGAESTVMEYEVENPKIQKGKMKALTGIYLHPDIGNANEDAYDKLRDRMRNGILIDGSYDDTNDRKTKKVDGNQSGLVNFDSSRKYYLQHLIYYELWDATVGLDAVYYWYRSKLTPYALYLTR
jgi:hypothetical protein